MKMMINIKKKNFIDEHLNKEVDGFKIIHLILEFSLLNYSKLN